MHATETTTWPDLVAALDRYPTTPAGAAPSSRVGRQRLILEELRLAARRAAGVANGLHHQQIAYRATIDRATPDADMVAVAVAEAGLRVLERYLPPAVAALRRADEDVRHAEQELASRWREARQVLDEAARAVQAGGGPEGRGAGWHDEVRHLLEQLDQLVGRPRDPAHDAA